MLRKLKNEFGEKPLDYILKIVQVLLLGFLTAYVSWSTLELQKNQRSIIEYEHQPQLSGYINLISDPATNIYADDRLEVTNSGFDVHNAVVRCAAFIQGIEYREGRYRKPTELLIPLRSYYTGEVETHSLKGKLATFWGARNRERLFNIVRAYNKTYDKDEEEDISSQSSVRKSYLSVIRFLMKISYDDFRNVHHSEYFEVDEVRGTSRIPDSSGVTLFNRFESFLDGIDLAKPPTIEEVHAVLSKTSASPLP